MRAILGRFTDEEENLAITVGNEFEHTTELIFEKAGLDLQQILSLEKQELKDYISSFKGLNITNLEMLAEILHQTGIRSHQNEKDKFLQKALELYNLCNESDHTYSLDRERKVNEIRNML